MDIKNLQATAKRMVTDALRDEAMTLAGRLDRIPKAERQGDKYKQGIVAWKVLRTEIESRKD